MLEAPIRGLSAFMRLQEDSNAQSRRDRLGSAFGHGRPNRDCAWPGRRGQDARGWRANPSRRNMPEHENEIVFEITQESDGGFVAECLTEDIYTEADSWDELRGTVRETVDAYFYDTAVSANRQGVHPFADDKKTLASIECRNSR